MYRGNDQKIHATTATTITASSGHQVRISVDAPNRMRGSRPSEAAPALAVMAFSSCGITMKAWIARKACSRTIRIMPAAMVMIISCLVLPIATMFSPRDCSPEARSPAFSDTASSVRSSLGTVPRIDSVNVPVSEKRVSQYWAILPMARFW